MKLLLSLPEQAACKLSLFKHNHDYDWNATNDPDGQRLGSGGGTAWLLAESYKKELARRSFAEWLYQQKRFIVHGGGLSRRLPAYAPIGKPFIPIPVFRWKRGQELHQTLLDLQVSLGN